MMSMYKVCSLITGLWAPWAVAQVPDPPEWEVDGEDFGRSSSPPETCLPACSIRSWPCEYLSLTIERACCVGIATSSRTPSREALPVVLTADGFRNCQPMNTLGVRGSCPFPFTTTLTDSPASHAMSKSPSASISVFTVASMHVFTVTSASMATSAELLCLRQTQAPTRVATRLRST